ncbi:HlyD family secretion protein [Undibacterium sp. Ji49W]|uniref:HlyD family secretion protein n=1 Tax=Undibacterium sp. Ji49W TaxID=3413040 RepID=UPI003BF43514
MSKLFRKEALDHQSQRYHGAILLTRTWSYPMLSLFLFGLIVLIVIFSLFFGFTRKETVSGMVVPDQGLYRLATPQSGIVSIIHVKEGQEVQAGEALFTLSGERNNGSTDTQASIKQSLQARIAQFNQELDQLQQQTKNKRMDMDGRYAKLQASLLHVDNELVLQRRRVQLVRDISNRMADLGKSGNVSKVALNEKAADVIEQESRLASIELEQLALQREVATLSASRLDLPLQAERDASQLKRNIEELQQQVTESEARRQLVIRADQPGRVAGIVVNRGQSVFADQRLANLMPAGSKLEVELYAPTRAAGFVSPGTEVMLRYDAFPYQKFGQFRGVVKEVSVATIALDDVQIGINNSVRQVASSGGGEPVYRLRVQLDSTQVKAFGSSHQLKPGMQLAATLVLEHRTLAQWVLEPLYGMASQL